MTTEVGDPFASVVNTVVVNPRDPPLVVTAMGPVVGLTFEVLSDEVVAGVLVGTLIITTDVGEPFASVVNTVVVNPTDPPLVVTAIGPVVGLTPEVLPEGVVVGVLDGTLIITTDVGEPFASVVTTVEVNPTVPEVTAMTLGILLGTLLVLATSDVELLDDGRAHSAPGRYLLKRLTS